MNSLLTNCDNRLKADLVNNNIIFGVLLYFSALQKLWVWDAAWWKTEKEIFLKNANAEYFQNLKFRI